MQVGKAPAQWRGFLLRSTDDGKTWGQPQELPQPVAGPAKNKPLELEDGTIVAGASDEGGKQGETTATCIMPAAPSPCRIVCGSYGPVLRSERLCCCPAGKSWSVWVETSRDVGQTWQRIGNRHILLKDALKERS